MGALNLDNTGSGNPITLSSNGTELLLNGSAIGGGGGASAYTREAKTANYTAVAGDLGKILDFTTNSSTLTLTAAATLGAGWYIWVKNSSSNAAHIVTVDANGSETIDGVVTRPMYRMESKQIVCDGSNFITIDGGVFGLAMNMDIPSVTYQPKPTGDNAIALGPYNYATGSYSFAAGYASTASGTQSTAIGYSADATAQESTAIGTQSQAEGNGSIGLGYNSYATGTQSIAGPQSRAAGTNSVAFGIGTNSSSYGAIGSNSSYAIGSASKANGVHALAIGGHMAAATNHYAIALGKTPVASGERSLAIHNSDAVADDAVAIGEGARAGSAHSFSLGENTNAGSNNAFAFGLESVTRVKGAKVYAAGKFAAQGDAQGHQYILRCDTTDATATVMTTNNSAAETNNQVWAGNHNNGSNTSDTCVTFHGTIVAMQNGAQAYGSWEIRGLLVNDNGTTTLPLFNISELGSSGWRVNLYADNTKKALKVQVTGEAGHNIRWVSNINTSEVTYA
tara:strand:+ start:4241 stop:5767 length:1527 start_codon:yes stop_codon:yes gene_type:complete